MTSRSIHISADGVDRADRGLRSFSRREGDAVFCSACDGDGMTIKAALMWNGVEMKPAEPVRCRNCNGEGLEP